MFFKLIEKLKSLFIFTTSYSNNVFLDPLSSEEEEECNLEQYDILISEVDNEENIISISDVILSSYKEMVLGK